MPTKKAQPNKRKKSKAPAGETLQRVKLDAFISELVIDWNPTAAAARIGIAPEKARKEGKLLVLDAYVSKSLNDRIKKMEPFDIVSRQQVMVGLLKEANDPSNAGFERIKAWETIAKMKGMDRPASPGTETGENGVQRGVLYLPAFSMADWEKDACRSQLALRDRARAIAEQKPAIDV